MAEEKTKGTNVKPIQHKNLSRKWIVRGKRETFTLIYSKTKLNTRNAMINMRAIILSSWYWYFFFSSNKFWKKQAKNSKDEIKKNMKSIPHQ